MHRLASPAAADAVVLVVAVVVVMLPLLFFHACGGCMRVLGAAGGLPRGLTGYTPPISQVVLPISTTSTGSLSPCGEERRTEEVRIGVVGLVCNGCVACESLVAGHARQPGVQRMQVQEKMGPLKLAENQGVVTEQSVQV